MGVSAASATAMAKKLASLGLVEHSRYHGVTLTPPGEKVALEVVRHHRLLEVYLTQTLGLSWDRVHSEAERLEHVLSEELEAETIACSATRTDPTATRSHPDLVMAAKPAQRMAELQPGQVARRQVPDGDPSLLHYLPGSGPPRTPSTMVEKAPFGGRLTLDVGGRQRAVGVELAGGSASR